MTPGLIEAIARAICGMPSCGASKCACGFAYDQMDAAQAALDAIKAAGFVIRPRGVKMVEREPFYFVEVPETD